MRKVQRFSKAFAQTYHIEAAILQTRAIEAV